LASKLIFQAMVLLKIFEDEFVKNGIEDLVIKGDKL